MEKDEVMPKAAAHWAVHGARLLAEDHLIELLHHLPKACAQVQAAASGARIGSVSNTGCGLRFGLTARGAYRCGDGAGIAHLASRNVPQVNGSSDVESS